MDLSFVKYIIEERDNDRIIEIFRDREFDYTKALEVAFEKSNEEIIDFIISEAKKKQNIWNEALTCAYKTDNKEIIELVKKNTKKFDIHWNELLANCNNLELIIKKGEDFKFDWNRGLYCACSTGNIKNVELMILHGADGLTSGLYSAEHKGHKEVIDYLKKNWRKKLEDDKYCFFD